MNKRIARLLTPPSGGFFIALLLLTAHAFGQASRYDNHAWIASNNVPAGSSAPILTAPNAIISVCNFPQSGEPCTNLTNIFSDAAMQSPLPNPLTADALGQFGFYLIPGTYVYTVQTQDGTDQGSFFFTAPAVGELQVFDVAYFVGADLGAQIQAADNALGSATSPIVVNSPGVLTTIPTMHDNRKVIFNAPVEVPYGSKITTGNNFELSCEGPGALITLDGAQGFLLDATSKSHVHVNGCSIFNAAHNGYLLVGSGSSVGASDWKVDNVHSDGANVMNTGGTLNTDMSVTNTYVTNSTTVAAVLLVNTIGAKVNSNHFSADVHGLQYSGGDANGGFTSRASDTLTGNIQATGNVCDGILGACLWGSMGFNVNFIGNTCNFAGDLCYDHEGSIDSSIVGNIGDCTGGNDCAAAFFGSDDLLIANNDFHRNDAGTIIQLKYSQGNTGPRHRNVKITGNLLNCTLTATLCNAMGSEGDAGVEFSSNTVHNGVYSRSGWHYGETIRSNHLTFDFISPTPFTAFNMQGTILAESWERFENNIIETDVKGLGYFPQQPTGSYGIVTGYGDYNNSDYFFFKGNEFRGFPVTIYTNNGGNNIGPTAYPHMWTYIGDNTLDHGTIQHMTNPITITDPTVCQVGGSVTTCTASFIEDNYILYNTNRLFDGSAYPGNTP